MDYHWWINAHFIFSRQCIEAIKEKGQTTYQYNKEKCIMESWRKMGDFWAETYRQVEAAQTAYRKNRTLANADRLIAALDGVRV